MVLGTELPYPQGYIVLQGKLCPLVVKEFSPLPILIPVHPSIVSRVRPRPISRRYIVVAAVHQIILKRLLQPFKIPGIIIPLQKQDVLFINFSDRICYLPVQFVDCLPVRLIELIKVIGMFAGGRSCGWLIHQIVARYRISVPVSLCNRLPECDDPFLKMAEAPEKSRAPLVITVPVTVLPSGQGMHIQDYVDTLAFTGIQYGIQTFKSLFLIYKGILVFLKMPVTQRNANAVGSGFPDQPDILLSQEVVEDGLKKQFCLACTNGFGHLPLHPALSTRISVDKILHVHPAAHAGTAKVHRISRFIHDFTVSYL